MIDFLSSGGQDANLLGHLWQHSPDNMFIVSLDEEGDFIIDDINPAQGRNLNLEADAVRKVKIRELFARDTAALVEAKYFRCLQQNRPLTEYEAVTLEGRQRYWNTLIIPIQDDGSGRRWIFGISREVTELERAKAALNTLNRQLEERVTERTAELEESNRQLRELAFVDELTGIGNRRYFELHANKLLALVAREKGDATLLMLDIDHFKRLNDGYGHPFGDRVLLRLAGLLGESVRNSDVLGRYGGEEFVILLPFSGPEEGQRFAQRLLEAVRDLSLPLEGDGSVRFSVSIGVASASAGEQALAEMIATADAALYRAKHNGRNRLELAQG